MAGPWLTVARSQFYFDPLARQRRPKNLTIGTSRAGLHSARGNVSPHCPLNALATRNGPGVLPRPAYAACSCTTLVSALSRAQPLLEHAATCERVLGASAVANLKPGAADEKCSPLRKGQDALALRQSFRIRLDRGLPPPRLSRSDFVLWHIASAGQRIEFASAFE
jgi:hypothetical protein